MTTMTISRRILRADRFWHGFQSLLNVATVGAMAIFVWAALIYAAPVLNLAGTEQFAQRILYIHLGTVFAALAAFLVSLVGSIAYLLTRNLDWDRATQASVEVGIIFAAGITVTGAVWARPAWNTYWTWDPRLTTSAITILIYLAYLLFRNGIDNRVTKAVFGNIYALVAFLSVPLTYYSARWFRSIHPILWDGANAEAQGDVTPLGPTGSTALLIAIISFSLLFSALMIARWRQLRLEDGLEELREEIEQ